MSPERELRCELPPGLCEHCGAELVVPGAPSDTATREELSKLWSAVAVAACCAVAGWVCGMVCSCAVVVIVLFL